MIASNRKALEKNEVNIEAIESKLPFPVKRHILTFFGQIGARDFKYSNRKFENNAGLTKFPTFCSNLLVLCSYMERAELAETIAMNLLYLIKVEETLTKAGENPKSLTIPVKIQDPHGEWIEGTPPQIIGAAGDRNSRAMRADEKSYGLVESLRKCFQDPKNHDKQLDEWFGSGSKEATKNTMVPYIAAMETVFQEVLASKEIENANNFLEAPEFLQIRENFKNKLKPDPDHVVKSGFLFDIKILIDYSAIFDRYLNNRTIREFGRIESAIECIIYPLLQWRLPRCDLGFFQRGLFKMESYRPPKRPDFSNGTPSDLSQFGLSQFIDQYGRMQTIDEDGYSPFGARGEDWLGMFSGLFSLKNNTNWGCTAPAKVKPMRNPS